MPGKRFIFNRAAVGWAVSARQAVYFLNRAAVGWAVSCSAFNFFFFFLTAQPQACAGLVLHVVFFFFLTAQPQACAV